MRRSYLRGHADDVAGGVLQRAIGTEADDGGAFEDRNPFITLLQVYRMGAAAGLLHLRIGHKFRGLGYGQTENGSHRVHMLKGALDVILRTARRRRGCRESQRGGVSRAGVDSADLNLLVAGQAPGHFIGFCLQ